MDKETLEKYLYWSIKAFGGSQTTTFINYRK